MENQNNLTLNDQAVDALRVSGKWCMFLAVIGFIGIGLMIIAAVFMFSIMSAVPNLASAGGVTPNIPMGIFGAMKGFLSALYIIIAIIYFFPIYYLYKYANGMKQALAASNSDILSEALVYLKSHHKFLGIMMIVVLSLYALIFIGAMIFAITMASGAARM